MSQEHSFASATPAGLGALAIAVFGFAAYFLGLVDVNGLPLLAPGSSPVLLYSLLLVSVK